MIAAVIGYWKIATIAATGTTAMALAWPYWEPYFPAHREYVIQAGSETRKTLDELILQGVNARRDSLRREQFEVEQSIKNKPTNFDNRKRLNEINESLSEVESKRKLLRKSLGQE